MIINPFNEREFKEDKLTIVDVKVTDSKGQGFNQVKPTISIWLLTQNITAKPNFHNVVEMRYRNDFELFLEHMEIHLLELSKWKAPNDYNEEDLWAFILSQPHEHFELPQLFTNPIMRRVMSQIREISDKETKWARYHSRMMWEHDQEAIRQEQEAIRQEKEAIQEELINEKELRLKAEQEKTELLERIAKLEAK